MRLALFGTVGAGKSSLSDAISKSTGFEIFPEPVDNNPYFDDYYNDMKAYVFRMQVWMLTARSKQLTSASSLTNVIFDRSIIEDPIFVRVSRRLGLLNGTDYNTYNDFFEEVVLKSLGERANFDLVVYLRVDTKKAIERIHERGRVQELGTDHAYWEILNEEYEAFYEKHKNKFNFLVIDANSDNLSKKLNAILKKMNEMK
ncbi:deoxynucleoside kinase [Spiroplasma endosymbiont of Othius punctulatus]|uniref:deoxynucleoside kinase n=1 Tax=Spiroplasma endosymbiont of Othius punctulatus TaxID=3066289 RepID=UPI0030CAC7F9